MSSKNFFFKKSKKLMMTSFFRSRSWSRTLPVSVSKPKLRSRPVLVSETFCGLGLGLGRVGLDYSPAIYHHHQSSSSPLRSFFHIFGFGPELVVPFTILDQSANMVQVFDVMLMFCEHQPSQGSETSFQVLSFWQTRVGVASFFRSYPSLQPSTTLWPAATEALVVPSIIITPP